MLNLDYRLAPEHPLPAAVDDAVVALAFIQANGPEGESEAATVFVGGDSAGGGLALSVLLAARERGVRMPEAAFGISAWTDLTQSEASIESRKEVDPVIRERSMLDGMASQYLGASAAEDPLASPLFGDLAGLPPLLLQVGDAEILLDDTTRVTAKVREAGGEVVEEIWPEMFHVWHASAPMLPERQQAVERIGEFVAAQIGARVSG